MILETVEAKTSSDTSKKKNGRVRGNSASGRGRGSRVNEQTKSQVCTPAVVPSNGHLENSYHKVPFCPSYMFKL